jgi:two-component system chemotaxis response regulator CheB
MIKVLVIDDSALVRQLLSEIINAAAGMEVVDVAADPYIAREKIKKLNPDVLTLDVEMPRMDGLTFLSNLMRLRPMPVVMISSLTEQGADVTLKALELGAVDFVSKPKVDIAEELKQYSREIVEKIRIAAKARVRALERKVKVKESSVPPAVPENISVDTVISAAPPKSVFRTTETIIGIGASTGGTEAIKEVLMAMPADSPGIVITQHIPAAFSAPFAQRVNKLCSIRVSEAKDGQIIIPGHAYIAPGNQHLIVERNGAQYMCRLNDGPPVNRHKPSVDVMFRSLANNAGKNAIGVMLTGMGEDGALASGEMKNAGAPILIQDEATSVVWGMPGEVYQRGFADEVLPLGKIADRITQLSGQ